MANISVSSIQIVEDDHSAATILKLLLQGHGYEIVGTAVNGQIAVEQYISFPNKPDIVLMDYRMPIKNGIEASIEILKICNQTKIIFTTADETIKEKALKIGAFDFVAKPFDFDELLSTINAAIKK